MTDLLALTAELVDIPSVSFDEADLVAYLEAELRAVPGLSVDRIGDNLVARVVTIASSWLVTPTPFPVTPRGPAWTVTPSGAWGPPT